ncbi:MAG: arginine--tRNA ligase [Nitrospirota bacterium]
MKKIFVERLRKSAKMIGWAEPSVIEVEIPPQETMGDLSTPLAMSLAGRLGKPPRKIAEEIANCLTDVSIFRKIEIAGPGFINVFFARNYLYSEIKKLLEQKSSYLRENLGEGKRVQVEFISANPTGPLHLGHGRGGATGNALANLLAAAGYEVEREYYINDAGRQVKLLGQSVFAIYKRLLGIETPFPEDGYRGGYIEEIADSFIKEMGDKYRDKSFEDVSEFFIDYAYKKILSGIRKDLSDFGIHFNSWQSERELYQSSQVQRAIEDLNEKGYIYEKDGALWFRATAFGDDKDRVIVKKDGEYTYFTSDIAYHRKKIDKNFYELIDIWGADHHGYIPRIKAVIEAFAYPKKKLTILLVQMVTLLRGGKPVQMSKRAGEFVTLREVMDEVGPDISKFIFLTRRPDSHLEFDLEVAKAQSSENPVFYVQYANARINSIFKYAKERSLNEESLYDSSLELLSLDHELRIIKKLLLYPMIFEGATNAREPHRITFYLQELSGLFHSYYNRHRIVGDALEVTRARLALCEAIRIVLRDGLEILGISAPEKM